MREIERSRCDNSQVAIGVGAETKSDAMGCLKDLAIIMGGALLDLPLLPAAEEEEEGGTGDGAAVEEEVAGFEGDVEV